VLASLVLCLVAAAIVLQIAVFSTTIYLHRTATHKALVLHPAVAWMIKLPLARRDIERLRQVIGLQRRLQDLSASPRAQRAITRRSMFRDALTWLEIHGRSPEVVEHWKGVLVGEGDVDAGEPPAAEGDVPPRRRRRRRRRRFRSAPQ